MYIGRENMLTQLDKMISNLDTNIQELSPEQTTTNGGDSTGTKYRVFPARRLINS
jgi:hypothetical protein